MTRIGMRVVHPSIVEYFAVKLATIYSVARHSRTPYAHRCHRMAKSLEPYRLFFLEDPLAPDQIEWFRHLRAQSATPIAMGELHNNPLEWRTLIAEQLIDFIRAHISQLGGITPARKLASLCEAFGVRTAWHGPGDTSPVGHAANLHS